MNEINPNASPEHGRFYYATSNAFQQGEVVFKGSDVDDACLFVTDNIDDCMALDGFIHVYEADAKTCSHYYPNGLGVTKKTLIGTFIQRFVDGQELPQTARFCDKLRIVRELPADEVFGPNGAQVAHVINWVRSKIEVHDDGSVVTTFRDQGREIVKYYTERLAAMRWPVPTIEFNVLQMMERRSETTNRFWLNPGALSKAWNAAYNIAIETGRVARCQYFYAVPPLMALVLRDKLLPSHFSAMRVPMERYFPIATLDSEVRGALYKA